jgi:HD-like signal output (HDOD) protein/prolyl-tRNA editing enzyme YbaK/EbsC (Cys-tRNA(Pro) deacylase)
MTIPNQIASCLAQQGIEFQIVSNDSISSVHKLKSATSVPTNAIVTTVVLGDSLGRHQVLFPIDCMLDLNQLCDQLGRKLVALSPNECAKLARKQGSETLHAVPYLYDLPIVVDNRLLKCERIYVPVYGTDSCLELQQPEFTKSIANADVAEFCVPISSLQEQQQIDDRAELEKAVKKFTTLRIRQRLEQTLEMPPLPDTAEKIIQLRLDQDAGVGELAKVVERDPSLAAQVVSWASSPYYAAPGAIRSVHDAVVRVLGFDLVINLALGLALGRSVAIPKDGPHGVIPYWQEAVYTAAMMEGLVKAMPADYRPSIGLAYLCGLLHNYGYLVLAHVFPPYFSQISRLIEANPHVNPTHIERHLIGITRDQIGSLLMDCWNMPTEVVSGLRWQQQLAENVPHHIYGNLLYLATQLLRHAKLYEGPADEISEELYRRLKIDPKDGQAVIERVQHSMSELKEMAKMLDR